MSLARCPWVLISPLAAIAERVPHLEIDEIETLAEIASMSTVDVMSASDQIVELLGGTSHRSAHALALAMGIVQAEHVDLCWLADVLHVSALREVDPLDASQLRRTAAEIPAPIRLRTAAEWLVLHFADHLAQGDAA